METLTFGFITRTVSQPSNFRNRQVGTKTQFVLKQAENPSPVKYLFPISFISPAFPVIAHSHAIPTQDKYLSTVVGPDGISIDPFGILCVCV